MSQSQNMCNDEDHSKRSETDSDTRPVQIARCRLGSEDLSDDQPRAVANAEDDAEGCGALEVAGKIAVEPDDAETSPWKLRLACLK